MKNKLTLLLLFACIASSARPISVKVENRFVRMGLEIDKKRIQKKFRLFFYVNKVGIEALRSKNGFVVPDELDRTDKVDVRVVFGKYDLLFEAVPTNAFKYDWIVGVDKKPFDSDNLYPPEKPPPGKKLVFIYYIHYVAKTREHADTMNVIKIYK